MKYNDYRNLGFTTLQNGLISNYSKLGISDEEFVLIIQLESFLQHGENFPSNEKLAANTNLSANDVAILIQRLINKKLLTIDQINDQQGRIGTQYSLNLVYEKLEDYLDKNTFHTKKTAQRQINASLDNDPLNTLSRQFEIEFGRYLSPIEREELAAWLNVDHYSPEIITLALREAVLSQAYSLKYIDRILLNWQRHNLKTVAEVKRFLQRNQ